MFRWLRWQWAKTRFESIQGQFPPDHIKVTTLYEQEWTVDIPPNTEAYDGLASFWDDFASWFVPDYAYLLAAAADYYRQRINTVLDLACGTGLLSRQLAGQADLVTGLDVSAAMLQEARSRTLLKHLHFVRGDFRDFSLEVTFDAIVCGSDSLNYVQTPEEIGNVFRCVYRHLRPGALFLFDVMDETALRVCASMATLAEVRGQPLEFFSSYDSSARVSEDRVVLGDAVERHRRIPIEKSHVRRAAREAELDVVEHFTQRLGLCARQFYILRRA